MKRLLLFLVLLLPTLAYSEAWLTVGGNHNYMLGSGTSVNLNITQPLYGPLSLAPYGSFDTNGGFRDRSGGLDINYSLTSRVFFSVGEEYEKYELLSANDPTETHNTHVAVHFKLW